MAREQRARRPAQLARSAFHEDVVAGLSLPQKALPPKYFYDAAGSRLFERICRVPEYYPTRAELALTRRHLPDIARFAGRGSALIEYGAGEGLKTRILIRGVRPSVYLPIDISEDALYRAAKRLQREFPKLSIVAMKGDFSRPLDIPAFSRRERRLVYFPGSTIGNLTPDEAHAFLGMTRGQVGRSGAMLVGVDLKKDPALLHAAYNDSRGITAAFNLNLLARINRELGGDFDPRRWRHYAFYNAAAGRVEMHLASLARQSARIGSHRFEFERGETIHTENSYKYSIEGFQALARAAGFRPAKVWLDPKGLFALHGLAAA